MIAPDKIYIPQHNIEAGTIQELDELIVEGSIEYIHKDALLEYLRKEWALVDFHLKAQPYDPVWWGQRNAFQQVIDKIESL